MVDSWATTFLFLRILGSCPSESLSSTFVFLQVTTDANSHINKEIASFYIYYLEGIFFNVRSTSGEQIKRVLQYKNFHTTSQLECCYWIHTFPHLILIGSELSIINIHLPSYETKATETKESAQGHTHTN